MPDIETLEEHTPFEGPRFAVRRGRYRHEATGHTPVPVVSGGASDANALIPAGLPVACLANGTERNHEPTERVSVAALEGMFDVTLALLEESAHA